jgi:hypothetical protein
MVVHARAPRVLASAGMSCVDGSCIARVDLMVRRGGRVQSCVRPVAAVHMTAGLDGMHGYPLTRQRVQSVAALRLYRRDWIVPELLRLRVEAMLEAEARQARVTALWWPGRRLLGLEPPPPACHVAHRAPAQGPGRSAARSTLCGRSLDPARGCSLPSYPRPALSVRGLHLGAPESCCCARGNGFP